VGRRDVEAATPPAWRGHGHAANMVVATRVPTVKLTKKEKLEAARVKFEFGELVAALGRNLGLEEADDDAPDEPEPMPATTASTFHRSCTGRIEEANK
jgi:hypothetical protein